MSNFWEDDLSAFLEDFGEIANLNGVGEVRVIFDNEFAVANLFASGIENANATATGLTSVLQNVSHGDHITIREIEYTISRIEPDGTGMTVLGLTLTES